MVDPNIGIPALDNTVAVDGKQFFIFDDETNGEELWVSDGTAAGTRLVKDINPGSGSSYPHNLTEFNGQLFFSADAGRGVYEVWASDGTESGTQVVRDIPGNGDVQYEFYSPNQFTEVGDQLFFSTYDGTTGRELWVISELPDAISGDNSNNFLRGTPDDDVINGLGGNDTCKNEPNWFPA